MQKILRRPRCANADAVEAGPPVGLRCDLAVREVGGRSPQYGWGDTRRGGRLAVERRGHDHLAAGARAELEIPRRGGRGVAQLVVRDRVGRERAPTQPGNDRALVEDRAAATHGGGHEHDLTAIECQAAVRAARLRETRHTALGIEEL